MKQRGRKCQILSEFYDRNISVLMTSVSLVVTAQNDLPAKVQQAQDNEWLRRMKQENNAGECDVLSATLSYEMELGWMRMRCAVCTSASYQIFDFRCKASSEGGIVDSS
jgi:predicted NAD-dependent protein-ADP-ribosyltransferase YbiA (DUF1768 family)